MIKIQQLYFIKLSESGAESINNLVNVRRLLQ
jgi:hypothetical protein